MPWQTNTNCTSLLASKWFNKAGMLFMTWGGSNAKQICALRWSNQVAQVICIFYMYTNHRKNPTQPGNNGHDCTPRDSTCALAEMSSRKTKRWVATVRGGLWSHSTKQNKTQKNENDSKFAWCSIKIVLYCKRWRELTWHVPRRHHAIQNQRRLTPNKWSQIYPRIHNFSCILITVHCFNNFKTTQTTTQLNSTYETNFCLLVRFLTPYVAEGIVITLNFKSMHFKCWNVFAAIFETIFVSCTSRFQSLWNGSPQTNTPKKCFVFLKFCFSRFFLWSCFICALAFTKQNGTLCWASGPRDHESEFASEPNSRWNVRNGHCVQSFAPLLNFRISARKFLQL